MEHWMTENAEKFTEEEKQRGSHLERLRATTLALSFVTTTAGALWYINTCKTKGLMRKAVLMAPLLGTFIVAEPLRRRYNQYTVELYTKYSTNS